MKENKGVKAKAVWSWIIRLVQGSVVGVGGIIPGISGGVLCAVFGLYEPLMETLAHPIKTFKKNFRLLLPVVIGIGFGFVALAKVVDIMFKSNAEVATALFVGLILGELPSLWKEAGEQGKRRASSYICLGAAFTVLFSILLVLELGSQMSITPNPLWFGISGLLLGLGVVIPGMSGSAPLTFLGLYEPLTELISGVPEAMLSFVGGKVGFVGMLEAMKLGSVIPTGIGILIPFAFVARPIHYCLKKFPSQMYHTIFGIVLATTVPTVIFKLDLGTLTLVKLGALAVGFVCAYVIDIISRKYAS